MKFSILITSFNKGKYIEECIKSCLEQTYNNFEIIVCDNYSTDNSEETFIKYAAKQSRISNAYKKWIGQDLGLRKKDAISKKLKLEEKWLNQNKENVNNQIFNIGDDKNNINLLNLSKLIFKITKVEEKINWFGEKDDRSYYVSFKKIRHKLYKV